MREDLWWTESWSPITGCTPVSEACEHCWARRMAQRLKGRYGYPQDDPFKVTFHPDRLDQPLRWKKPRMIFVCSMGDLFHADVRGDWMWRILDTCYDSKAYHKHIFMFLTKRPERMAAEMDHWMRNNALSSLPKRWWLGVTAENQQRADERIPILLQIPAAKRFVSMEPMLGPVDLTSIGPHHSNGIHRTNALRETIAMFIQARWTTEKLDWVIVGGESGPGARPIHPDWARSVRDQCQEAGVRFFFKQWGEWIPRLLMQPDRFIYREKWGTLDITSNWFPETTPWNGHQGEDSDTKEYVMYRVGKKAAGHLLDGQQWNERPIR